MDIIFQNNHIKSYLNKMIGYDLQGYKKENINLTTTYKYLPQNVENYIQMRLMHGEGVQTIGYIVYVKLLKIDYLTNLVPMGLTNSIMLDVNGLSIGVQKKWFEWNPIIMESNDSLEVIISTNYENQAATTTDLNILEDAVDVIELMGQTGLVTKYQNNINWVVDENGDPIIEEPIIKTASYYTSHWEGETFDFIDAQHKVKEWFFSLTGVTNTNKFNSLSNLEKSEVIRWGILPRDVECNLLIETFLPNNNYAASLRLWNMRRGFIARSVRFEVAFSFLIDNINDTSITKVDNMLISKYKEFYLYYGTSTSSEHLIVNGELNPIFWNIFTNEDVAYSNMTLVLIKEKVQTILNGDRFITNFI